jgi:catalase
MQSTNLYRLFNDGQREKLARRTAGVLSQARQDVRMWLLCNFFHVDEEYRRRIVKQPGVESRRLKEADQTKS